MKNVSESDVLNALKHYEHGATSWVISKKLKVKRESVSKVLQKLKRKRCVEFDVVWTLTSAYKAGW